MYPSWRYHKTEPAKIVRSEEEDKSLGKGWAHSPAEFEAKKEEKPAKEVTTTESVKTETVEAPQASEKPKKEKKAKKEAVAK